MALPAPQSMASPSDGAARRCIVSGVSLAPSRMLRFVVGPDGVVAADVAGRLPGHGIWLCADRATLETACRKRLFAKAAKAAVTVPQDLPVQLERLLARQCLNLIAFARRAGQAVSGAEKTRGWLKSGKAGVLVLAADGSPSETAQMRALAPSLPRIETLTAMELAGVFDRARTVHAAITGGRLADRIVMESGRLAGFRMMAPERAPAYPRTCGDGGTEG